MASRTDGICCRCRSRRAIEGQAYCRPCWRDYQRDPAERLRKSARNRAYRALKKGTLRRQRCRDCGAENAQMHHPDYREPLRVEWLCPKHHRMLHAKEPKR